MNGIYALLATYLMARGERVRTLLIKHRWLRRAAFRWFDRRLGSAGRLDKNIRLLAFTLAGVLSSSHETLPAFRLYKRLCRWGDPHGSAGWGLFRTLVAKKRYRVALKVAATLAPNADKFGDFYLFSAEAQAVLGDVEAARASIERWRERPVRDASNWRETIVAAHVAHAHAAPPEGPPRHIALGGDSYVGSTVLGLAMGSIDGIGNIGESHWLTEWRSPDGNRPIDFDQVDTTRISNCNQCGPNCPVLTREFRSALQADPVNWYDKIVDRLGAKRLLSSDKSLLHYWRLDPLHRYDLVILYKSPLNSTQSAFRALARRRRANATLPGGEHTTATQHLDNWVFNYFGLLRNVHPRGKRLVMNWDTFVQSPLKHMEILCSELNLAFSPNVFSSIRPQHTLGGNGLIDYREIMATREIKLTPSNVSEADATMRREVSRHTQSQFIFRLLENEHRRTFGTQSAIGDSG